MNRALAAFLILFACLAHADIFVTPRWIETGHLGHARWSHAAALLHDGRVLVVGGQGELIPEVGRELASAELYDPALGRWQATGSLAQPRAGLTATTLGDGRVLVTGGAAGAELYDPASGTWTSTAPPLGDVRYLPTATLLPSGKVLVVGGLSNFNPVNIAELYDPATDRWQSAGSPRWSRWGHTATLLANGTVLVAGGLSEDYDPDIQFPPPQKAEIYDPASNAWREVGTPIGVIGAASALLSNGKVLIAGGATVVSCAPPQGCAGLSGRSAQLFDSVTESWATTGNLVTSHGGAVANVLPDGKVLITGGGSATSEEYDRATGLWTATSPLSVARDFHTATLLANGNVLVAGGAGTAGNTAEVFGVGPFLPASIGPAYTGAWYDPAQSGHGLFIEILSDNRILATWFAFNPAGTKQAWFTGVGTYSGDTATIAAMDQPSGGRWIPNFDPAQIVHNAWGTLTIKFVDCDHGTVDFNSVAAYGAGSMDITRLTQPAGLACP